MPLVRFEVRNEVGLGNPELYRGAGKRGETEPKALLEGVAVAGLVGILRQLGDLAEFAADVFHDLHEQIITTSARGRKVLTRVQNIETALPSLEKAVKSQTSHIHFAYVPGSDWHAQLQNEQNHLLSSDLPRYMMDSYEECRDPPRLYLLDKFDNAGAGACLKRYSDPSYFKRAWDMTKKDKAENTRREKRAHKTKRKGSRLKDGEFYHTPTISRLRNGGLQQELSAAQHIRRRFASPSTDGQSFSENRSTPDVRSNPEILSRSSSFGSKTRLSSVDQALDTKPLAIPDESGYNKPSDVKLQNKLSDASSSILCNGDSVDGSNDDSKQDYLQDQPILSSPSVTWDEKAEIVVPTSSIYCDDIVMDKVQDIEPARVNSGQQENGHTQVENLEQQEVLLQKAKLLLSSSGLNHHDEVNSETDNYMDALNTLESETETEAECRTKSEIKPVAISNLQVPQVGDMQDLVSHHPCCSDSEVLEKSHISGKSVELPDLSNPVLSEISVPTLSACTVAPPNVGPSVVNDFSVSNVEDTSAYSTEAINCDASCKPTISSTQAVFTSEHFEKASFADNSPVDTNVSHDISQSKAQDSLGKNDEGVGCGVSSESSISVIQINSTSESSEKRTATQNLPTDTSVPSVGSSSIKLWTNAGLFGLEPSKPPDFGAQSSPGEDILQGSKEHRNCGSNDNTVLHHAEVPESAADVPNGNVLVTSNLMGKLVGILPSSINHNSSGTAQSEARTRYMVQSDEPSDSFTSFEHGKYSSISEVEKSQDISENGVQMYPTTDTTKKNGTSLDSDLMLDTKAVQEHSYPFDSSKSISSSFASIAQRFLANTLQRKTSPNYADLPTSSGRGNSNATGADESTLFGNHNAAPNGTMFEASQIEHKRENGIGGSSKASVSSSCHYSEQSSPPLEHMKISFHPMNASELSKLNFEFSDGHLDENAGDLMLATSCVPLQGSGSESEDDTFCRSYSYSSYDDLSPRLYSNSEVWDQDEGIGLEELELYNNSNKIESSTTPISSYVGFEQLNFSSMNMTDALAELEVRHEPVKLESHPVELPNFDAFLTANNEHNRSSASMPCNPAILSSEYQDQMPPPPPLPPMQWRMMRPASLEDDAETKAADRLKKASSLPPLRSATDQRGHVVPIAPPFAASQPPEHAKKDNQKADMLKELSHLPNIMEIKTSLLQQIRDKPDQQKLNGHEKPKAQCLDTNDFDEREELLHQIRSKTFNLRRTNIPKPNASSQSAANSNVVAILEKANAIRQAVASDEGGDDDSWSDI